MKCLFSGADPDTKEHVIPLWLQQRMNLRNDKLTLPNRTMLPYKHAVVPAETSHNGKFSEIEDRISRGIFNLDEVYLWALKIHVGLLSRDSTLKADIRDSNSEAILDLSGFNYHLTVFRTLYQNWASGGTTAPTPFGSVFILDSLTPRSNFDLVHCAYTGALGIDIGEKFIFVTFWDRGRTLNSNALTLWHEDQVIQVQMLKNTPEYEAQCWMVHRIWACETAYFQFLSRENSMTILKTPGTVIASPSSPNLAREMDATEYALVCKNFGIQRDIAKGKYIYTQFTSLDEAMAGVDPTESDE